MPLWFGTPEEPLEFLRVPPIARGEGASGEIRGAEAGRRLRFTRAFGESPDSTTVQLTVLPGTDRDDDRVHEERLAGPAERAESIREWKAALARIASAFEGSAPDRAEEEES